MLSLKLLLLLGALSLVFYLREKLRACTLRAVFLKALTSVFFVCVAAFGAIRPMSGAPGMLAAFVIPGLVLGLLGDVWLDLKYVFPEQDGPFTYAGFTVFGLGHVLFIAGLALQYGAETLPLSLLLGLAAGIVTVLLEKPMKLCYGKMKPVVAVYGMLLFSTVTVSGCLALRAGFHETALNLFFAGAVLFALSDLVLSGTYFGEGRSRPVDLLLNYLSYYPAQFLIALSLYYL